MPITPIGNILPASICPFCKTNAQQIVKPLYYTCEHEDPPLEGHYEQYDASITVCTHCEKETIWYQETIIYPKSGNDIVPPKADLPKDIQGDYLEAASIVGASPRGAAALLRLCIQKLCNHVLSEHKNIDRAIEQLAKNDLISEETVKRLDIVRLIGNDAVHPGAMDLKDDQATARELFVLFNECAESMITRRNSVTAMYDKTLLSLPEGKRDGINQRNQRAEQAKQDQQ